MPDLLDPFRPFDFAAAPGVVVAVSGGSDSTALLILLKRHLDQLGAKPRLVAVTVDHGLRPGSAAEAVSVAQLARTLGVAHRTVTWTGDKPATGLAAAARDARYRLLAEAATAEGAAIIVTGHTADDQAETVSMRRARGGGGRGMAGMAPATLYEGRVWIVRPLLHCRRESLREFLRGSGIAWIDDPTNADHTYERPRTRAALGRSRDGTEDVLARAAAAATARQELGSRAAGLISGHATLAAPGLVHLSPAFLQAPDAAAAVYALRLLLAVQGGGTHLPDEARALALIERLRTAPFRATLSRAMVESRRDGIYLLREGRGLPPEMQARHGMLWDGRFRIRQSEGANDAMITAGVIAAPDDPSAPARLVRAALAAQPSFCMADGIAPGWQAQPLLAPWSGFLPSFDLAPAHALATLIGAEEPPEPPCAHHNVRSP